MIFYEIHLDNRTILLCQNRTPKRSRGSSFPHADLCSVGVKFLLILQFFQTFGVSLDGRAIVSFPEGIVSLLFQSCETTHRHSKQHLCLIHPNGD